MTDLLPFQRLWVGFLTARIMVALTLLSLLLGKLLQQQGQQGQQVEMLLFALSASYFLIVTFERIVLRHSPPKPQPGLHWFPFIGVDLALVCGLQWLQHTSALNFTPLFGLPILMASVLGTLTLALGTAAAASLLLLAWYWWLGLQGHSDDSNRYLQAALAGTGYFLIAWLANQLAARLISTQQIAHRHHMDARTQREISELVIQNIQDGVLVVDRFGMVRLANPAALLLLGSQSRSTETAHDTPLTPPFFLSHIPAWLPLAEVAQQTLDFTQPQTADVDILHEDQTPMHLRVRAWRTCGPARGGESLCVMFLHDLRVMQEQLRTEKLAAMGRVSTALAHEFRNPLNAIAQASQLLDEDLADTGHQRLTRILRQNVERLTHVTRDVLDIATVRQQTLGTSPPAMTLELDDSVRQTVADWQTLDPARRRVHLGLDAEAHLVAFELEHLRRILVNLLDNALRYRSEAADALCVFTHVSVRGTARLEVWSDGAPLDRNVERHLFEPFSSSQSRSTGLGLYICRELCQRHMAAIDYQRLSHRLARGQVEGNAFIITFFRGPDFSPTMPFEPSTTIPVGGAVIP